MGNAGHSPDLWYHQWSAGFDPGTTRIILWGSEWNETPFTCVDGKPTMTKEGRPLLTSASTLTGRTSTPIMAADKTLANKQSPFCIQSSPDPSYDWTLIHLFLYGKYLILKHLIQERILQAGFSACGGSLQRHNSSPPQCNPARKAFNFLWMKLKISENSDGWYR